MKTRLTLLMLVALLTAGASSPGARGAAPSPSPEEEVLALTRELLENIYLHPNPDFYAAHSVPELTAFEGGPRIEGLDLHLFALQQLAQRLQQERARGARLERHLELINPRVQLYADTAIVTFTSGVWTVGAGEFSSEFLNETRVWVRQGGEWKLAHFHKSPYGPVQ
ncbi:DUF4440 domain-containing protein [Acidobacteriia bacterium AH_259_A11_L15]|nr:DUF4440 domain-containing protein [Acidobacteriia bacterium AH_259_A11_L15]